MKHYKSIAALAVAALACLLICSARAEAKLVPVDQAAANAPANARPASAHTEAPKNNPSTTAPASAPAPAADDDRLPFMVGPEHNANVEQPSAIGMLARTFGALLLVIGLLIGGIWALRRIKGSPFAASRDDARLVVLKTLSIGDRRSLTLVRFGDRTLLLGSTQQSVTLLATDDDEDLSSWPTAEQPTFRSVADVLAANVEDAPPQAATFASELEQVDEWRDALEGGRRERNDRSAKWR